MCLHIEIEGGVDPMPASRRRFFEAIERREPDCVPITDLGLDPPIVEAITGECLEGFSMVAPSGRDLWEASIRGREALARACLKLGFDAIPAVSDYSLASKEAVPKFLTATRFIDEWGRIMDARPETKTTWWVGGTLDVEDVEEAMEAYFPPDPEAEGRFEMIQRLVKPLLKKDVAIMAQGHSGWHMAFQVRGGIDKLILDMYRRPKAAKNFMEKVANTCFGMVKLMVEGGVEVLFITDDYADNRTPFMNLQLFREFELPNLRRIIEFADKRGVPVLKHSDGNLYPIIDDMLNVGIKGLHPIEPGTMDLADVKRRYGDRICLLGNVDCRYVLPFGSEEDVRRDVRRCIDEAAEGGGFVLTSSNSIHANCKVENVYAMVDEARKYGKYPLRVGR
ncbi:MAG: uroporphyrinogen decarboxylase family protein [Candidatus Bathyarchaeia archaeon]